MIEALRCIVTAENQLTVHGFRSTFRDWAAECTAFSNEVCEAALAHAVKGKVEAAYRRGDLFEKRVRLMQAWSDYQQINGSLREVPADTAAQEQAKGASPGLSN